MAGHGYMSNGYSTYNDVSAQEGGYAHGRRQPVGWYVVETTTIERIRTPSPRYFNFGDEEYNHSPRTLIRPNPLKDYQEGYEPDYGSDFEKSSSPRYHGGESLKDKFLNKVQIKGSSPVKTSSLSSPRKYQPTSPTRSHPSEEANLISDRNLSSPKKYQPTSPMRDHSSDEKHLIKDRTFQGPNKYQPTSPVHNYPSEESHLTKTQSFSDPNKYLPTTLEHKYPPEESYLIGTQNASNPNKYQPTSLMHSYPPEDTQTIRTRNFSGPNNLHPLSLGSKSSQHGEFRRFSGSSNHWMSAGPPMTHHPLTAPTNDINEALGFLQESINHSLNLGPKRAGTFDNFSPRAHPIEHEWEYAKPTFVSETTRTQFKTNTIDSQEAIRRYQGTRVP